MGSFARPAVSRRGVAHKRDAKAQGKTISKQESAVTGKKSNKSMASSAAAKRKAAAAAKLKNRTRKSKS